MLADSSSTPDSKRPGALPGGGRAADAEGPTRTRSTPPGAVPRVSGALLRDQHPFMVAIAGQAAMDRALASLEPAAREEYESMVSISWCSITTVTAVAHAVAREANLDVTEMKRQVIRAGAQKTLNTLWRFLLRHTSDEALMRRMPIIYTKTYDSGQLTARMVGPGHAESVVSGWDYLPTLDGDALGYGAQTVLELAGRTDVKVKWIRVPGGARYDAYWTPLG